MQVKTRIGDSSGQRKAPVPVRVTVLVAVVLVLVVLVVVAALAYATAGTETVSAVDACLSKLVNFVVRSCTGADGHWGRFRTLDLCAAGFAGFAGCRCFLCGMVDRKYDTSQRSALAGH